MIVKLVEYVLPPLIVVLIGLYRFRYIRSQYLLIFIFVSFSCFTEIFSRIAISWFKVTTLPALHFYIIIEFLLLSLFYWKMLAGFINKIFFWSVFVLFESYAIINPFFIQELFVYPNFVRAIGSLIILFFAILFFMKIMTEAKVLRLANEPAVWINMAFILYLTPFFFYNILFNALLENNRTLLTQIVNMNGLFLVIENCLIAVGFWKAWRPEMSTLKG